MAKRMRGPPHPMHTKGFAWRVAVSIFVVFGWLIFLILWLLFYAGNFNVYQNLAIIIVSVLVGIAILGATWASWGIRYRYRYGNEWKEDKK
jgi:membrane protein YdbS with pleckstrin-like domain